MNWRITDAIIPATVGVLGAVLVGVWISIGTPHDLVLAAAGTRSAGRVGRAVRPRRARHPWPGSPQAGRGSALADGRQLAVVPGPGAGRHLSRYDHAWLAAGRKPGRPVLWTVTLGEGYAGAAIHQGRVYVLDYDEQAKADTLALSVARRWTRDLAQRLSGRHHAQSWHVAHGAGDCERRGHHDRPALPGCVLGCDDRGHAAG